MSTRTCITLVIACLATSLADWVGWGIYTVHAVEGPITWGYILGSTGCVLTPLILALILLAMVT